jgi:hypothetical protein
MEAGFELDRALEDDDDKLGESSAKRHHASRSGDRCKGVCHRGCQCRCAKPWSEEDSVLG